MTKKQRALFAIRQQETWEQCGSCNCYHPKGFDGDCRDDENRLPIPPLDFFLYAVAVELKTLRVTCERLLDHCSCQYGGWDGAGTVPQRCYICDEARAEIVKAKAAY